MIDLGAVGARFTIKDEASPVLKAIVSQLENLDRVLKATKDQLRTFRIPPGVNRALLTMQGNLAKLEAASTTASNGLIANFSKIDTALTVTQGRVAALGAEMRALSSARVPAIGYGGGGGRAHVRPGSGSSRGGGGAGGPHFGSVGTHLPGGSHVRFGAGPAMAAAGMVGYGVYEEGKLEDTIFQLLYHTGLPSTPENNARFRKILQDSMSETGFGVDAIGEAAKTEARMFKGTPGGGLDVMPEILRAAAIEARLKGSTLEESVSSLIGLAHMTKQYSPDEIKKLAPAFAFLSASNPASLKSIEAAAGYAVPILQSGLEIDPVQSLLMGTVLTRAGATSTKSGTWLRNMMLGAMPGTSSMTKKAFEAHEDALLKLGLVDDKHQPTWFTNGKPDPFRMLDIASERAAAIPLAERAGVEKKLFGVQGNGGFALLADPAVREQLKVLKAEMDNPETKARYEAFLGQYNRQSPVQQARGAWADFTNVATDIGQSVLPLLTGALQQFDGVLKGLHSTLGDAGANTVVGGGILAGAAGYLGRKQLASALPYFATLGGGAVAGAAGLAGGLGLIASSGGPEVRKALADAQAATDALHMPTPGKGFGAPSLMGMPGKEPFVPSMPDVISGTVNKAVEQIPGKVDPTVKSSFAQIQDAIVGAIKGLAAAASAAAAAIPTSIPAPTVEHHTELHVDGRKLAQAVTRHQARGATQVASGANFDDRRHMAPVDGWAYKTA